MPGSRHAILIVNIPLAQHIHQSAASIVHEHDQELINIDSDCCRHTTFQYYFACLQNYTNTVKIIMADLFSVSQKFTILSQHSKSVRKVN